MDKKRSGRLPDPDSGRGPANAFADGGADGIHDCRHNRRHTHFGDAWRPEG